MKDKLHQFIGAGIFYASARVLLLAQIVILNRDLTPENIRQWALLDSSLTFIYLIADLGVRNQALRRLSIITCDEEKKKQSHGYLVAQFIAGIITFSLGLIVLNQINFLSSINFEYQLIYSMSLIFFATVSLEWYWMSAGLIKKVAFQRVIYEAAIFAAILIFAKKLQIESILIGMIAAPVIVLVLSRNTIKSILKSNAPKINPIEIILSSTALFITTILGQVWLRIPAWLLATTAEEDLAHFWMAFKLLIVLLEILSVLNQLYYPGIAEATLRHNTTSEKALLERVPKYVKITKLIAIFSSILGVVGLLSSKLMIDEVGKWFLIGGELALVFGMWSKFSPSWNYLLIKGLEGKLSKYFTLSIISNVAVFYLLQEFGLATEMAAATSFLISTAMLFAFVEFISKKSV